RRFIDSTVPRCYVLQLLYGRGRSVSSRPRRSSESAERKTGVENSWVLNRNASRSGGVSRVADVAQEVEQLTCNQQVVGSTPTIGSSEGVRDGMYGTERCPSGQREQTVNLPAFAFGGSNPPLSMECNMIGGSSSVGRARAFQARGR